jgi:hypothetical protein
VVALACLALACGKSEEPKGSAKSGKDKAAPAKEEKPKPKRTAAELLKVKGDGFPVAHAQLEKDQWIGRLGSFLKDGPSPEVCGPSTPPDACKKAMDKALKALGNCPVRATIGGTLKPYDAAAKALPVELTTTQITNDGLVWLDDDVLVEWPGAARAVVREPGVDPCKAEPKVKESVHSLAAVKLEADENEAKEAAEKIKGEASIDVLYVLDKRAATGTLACGTALPKPQAAGKVVAYRMRPALGWHTIAGSDWSPPKECKSARTFFGMPK